MQGSENKGQNNVQRQRTTAIVKESTSYNSNKQLCTQVDKRI